MHPEYPPRVRVEWLIAITRVVFAGGALLSVWLDSSTPAHYSAVAYAALLWYVAYAGGLLALVWKPVRLTSGWGFATHLFDLAAFSVLMFFTEGEPSLFFLYFVFLVVCGTLRWQARGIFWTTVAAIAAYAAVSAHAVLSQDARAVGFGRLLIRGFQLAGVAALLGYLGAYQHRLEREISRIALWPRRVPGGDSRELVTEIIVRAGEILEASNVVLIWEEPGHNYINLAWRSGDELVWTHEPEATYGSFVAPGLEHKNFQAPDASSERGRVVEWSAGRLHERRCRPINETLRARFAMRAVQSWSLDGEFIRGRIFCLEKRPMLIDDLIVGDLVARLAVSHLDSLYVLGHLQQAVASEERLRVARDLHDSLAQALAGTALQLLAARRLLESNPLAARERLGDVQSQLERGEFEVRSLIRRLRPTTEPGLNEPRVDLKERLELLRQRVEGNWEIKVSMRLQSPPADWPDSLVEHVYRLVDESVLNAARHADASQIRVDLAKISTGLKLEIEDDGRGFPFHGTYDLAALTQMNRGPLTVRERVAELQGDLSLQSTNTGTKLSITLPVAQASSY